MVSVKVREQEQCWKCRGTGQYRNLGVCFLCKGTGKVKSGRAILGNVAAKPAHKIDCANGLHDWFAAPFGEYCGQCRVTR